MTVLEVQELQAVATASLKAQQALVDTLEKHGFMIYFTEGGDSWAVHPQYLQAFENGLYDVDTETWHPDAGKVPEYALFAV